MVRDFELIRDIDVTGRSGTGVVAEGVVFSDGLAVLRWLREPHALGVFDSLEALISVHGHEGRTYVAFREKSFSGSNP